MSVLKAIFISPWMLAGLVAALTPLVIEWLFRRRKRQVELPTIRFLLGAKEQESIRRQDRILLLLRTAAIVLLVLAVARPVVRTAWVGSRADRRVVMLIDGTSSMRQIAGGRSSFQEAVDKAGKAIAALPNEDASVSVVFFGDGARSVVENSGDLVHARGKCKDLRPTSGDAPLAAGLIEVEALLDRCKIDGAELYIFSDCQRHTWTRPWTDPKTNAAVNPSDVLARLDGRCKVSVVDVGGSATYNYFVSDLRPVDWVLSADTPVEFEATIKSIGQAPEDAKPAKVKFIVNDDVIRTVEQVRPTEQGVTLRFDYRFAPPKAAGGSSQEYLVEVEVSGDSHHADNRRFYLCNVPAAVKVLLLDATAGKDEPQRDSVFLARAIVPPTHPGVAKLSHFAVDTAAPDELARVNIDDYAVVVLAGVDLQDASAVGRLERYVVDGGALWIFLGPNVNLHDYNRLLYKNGSGLLPVQLPEEAPAPPGDEPVFPRFGMSRHPALAVLTDHGGSADAAFRRFVPLTASEAGRVVLELSDGTPAMVERTFGSGRVLLTNTTVSSKWTLLPATSEYAVMVQELLRYLVGQPDRTVNLSVGLPFIQPVYISDQQLIVRLPDGGLAETDLPTAKPHSYELRFNETGQEGLYEVENASGFLPRTRFVVNQGSSGSKEGDLARLDRDGLTEAFRASRLGWISRGSNVAGLIAQDDTELAAAVFWSLTALLAAESLLAWRFGRRREEAPV